MSRETLKVMPSPPWRIGVDIGGTFTDLVLVDSEGKIRQSKSPSDPSDPAKGFMNCLSFASESFGLTLNDLLSHCSTLIHGTTIATNILLERTGAKVGMITTFGFRDTLEIRRAARTNMWDHRTPWDEVLVPRNLRLGVHERIGSKGEILKSLDKESVVSAASKLKSAGVEAIAVCLLNSYKNSAHEEECKELLENALPGTYITISTDLSRNMGEFERSSTVAANAYVAPRVIPYLKTLSATLRKSGLNRDLFLVQSNGGAISLDEVICRPSALALSGPAAGVSALKYFERTLGSGNMIAIEIGGTSCDVTLVRQGQVAETESLKIGDILLSLPVVEIHTVSTGGGSIAAVDTGGLITVGPKGAGSTPGPACYNRGGQFPTTTDAQVVLGRLRGGSYAGGAIQITPALARKALQQHVAEKIDLSTDQSAAGVVRLADQQVRHAIDRVSVERGLDPKEFILVGAGGAGGLHVASVARTLGCSRAYVPKLAGVFCALGMCNSNIRHDLSRPLNLVLQSDSWPSIIKALGMLEAEICDLLKDQGFSNNVISTEFILDMRYTGQQWVVPTNVLSRDDAKTARAKFEESYKRQYGFTQPDALVEVVNVKVVGTGELEELTLAEQKKTEASIEPLEERQVLSPDSGEWMEVPSYNGKALYHGHCIHGPAIIEEETTTIFVNEGDSVTVDQFGNYLIQINLVGGV